MKQKLLLLSCLILFIFALGNINIKSLAETSGSSPESGTDSKMKTAYDWLVAKGSNYGSTDAADWSNDWGTMWNRIMEAATWEPEGTLTVDKVSPGETFYSGNDNRTLKTGIGTIYSNQSLLEWDDYKTGDETGEEATWTNTAGTATTGVWKDNRTGLYWSPSQGQNDNIFPDTTHTACPFFTSTPRGSYDGTDADCGDAINICGLLDLASGGASNTDWYLPSQKELLQAYIDGIYNQTNATFVSTNAFWSSTEKSNGATSAWSVESYNNNVYSTVKTISTFYIRCVRRD